MVRALIMVHEPRQARVAGEAYVGTISPQSRCDFAPSMAQNTDEVLFSIKKYLFTLIHKNGSLYENN